MEKSPAAVAAYASAVPQDERVERKQMFGMPCAFVNRQMFFGTFGDSLIARVGPERVTALVGQPGITAFEPMEGRPWNDYVQIASSAEPELLERLAAEALAWTLTLPPKAKKPRAARKAKKE